MEALDKFRELPNLDGDEHISSTGLYIPCLYCFDLECHVSWTHFEDGDVLLDFIGNSLEEAIDKAFLWYTLKVKN